MPDGISPFASDLLDTAVALNGEIAARLPGYDAVARATLIVGMMQACDAHNAGRDVEDQRWLT